MYDPNDKSREAIINRRWNTILTACYVFVIAAWFFSVIILFIFEEMF